MMKRLVFLTLLLTGILSTFAQSPHDSDDNKALLSSFVNSDYQEVMPLISPDGKSLYFNRRNHPENVFGKKDAQDIWVSRMNDAGEWGAATNLGKTVNDKHANAICAISPNGKTGIFYNTYSKGNHPLAKSSLINNEWTRPQPIVIEDYYNINQFADFYTCFITNVLLLAIEREDSRGDQDLYICLMDNDGNYQKPINLGDKINSSHADFAPFLASDGKSLFFASYGHKGMGGSDIFMSQRLDDTWINWSAPVNVGSMVNSSNNETYFSLTADFRYMYLDTFTPLAQKRDITRLMVPDEIRPRQYQEATIAPKVISLFQSNH